MEKEEVTILLHELKKGNREAFSKIFQAYYGRLVWFAGTFLGSQQDAEDVVSTLFINFWQKRTNLRAITYPETYLYSSVKNACNINIEVKGTAFNVNAYKTNKAIEVLLVRGLVEVSNKYNKDNKVLLNPNQLLTAPTNNQKELAFNIKTVDTIPVKNIALSYLDTLVFKKEKLKDLAKQLKKKYQVVINIKTDALKEKRFSGMFGKESLSEALEALRISFPFSYKIDSK